MTADWLGWRKDIVREDTRWLGRIVGNTAFILGIVYLLLTVVLLALTFLAAFSKDDGADVRNVGLVLVAFVGGPLLVWRAVVAAIQADTGVQSHITEQINAAVLGLGAEKKMSRIGRTVTLGRAPGNKELAGALGEEEHVTPIEWQGEGGEDTYSSFDRPVLERGAWQVFTETRPNLEVRIGAILSLERIAQKSDEDHVRIMEILCAYIRENTKGRTDPDPPDPGFPTNDDAAEGFDWAARRTAYSEELEKWRAGLTTRTDVQMALNVLGRRSAEQRRQEAAFGEGDGAFPFDAAFPDPPADDDDSADWAAYLEAARMRCSEMHAYAGYRLDVRGADLRGYDLAGKDYAGVDFRGARLQGVNIRAARLQGADFREARLQGAVLDRAVLQGAQLGAARLEGAYLWAALLQGAGLSGARMNGASLREAQMEGAFLVLASLEGADLRRACMKKADLSETQMGSSILRGARMEGTNLHWAQMTGANFIEAKFDNYTNFGVADVRFACVHSCDLSKSLIGRDQINAMFGDGSVTLPDGIDAPFEPEGHWPREALDCDEFEERWRVWRTAAESG